jgi:YVTN family beta-propeller protein
VSTALVQSLARLNAYRVARGVLDPPPKLYQDALDHPIRREFYRPTAMAGMSINKKLDRNWFDVKLKSFAQSVAGACLASTPFLPAAHAAPAMDRAKFELTQRYTLGGADRWDYLGYDLVRHPLFINRVDHVHVVDTDTGKLIGEIADTAGVHGFAFVQERKLGFITNGRADTIAVMNRDTLQTVGTIKTGGPNPDVILYVRKLKRIYTSNGHDNGVGGIDVATRKIVATIPVGGKPESLAAGNHGHLFVAVEDKGEIVAMDGESNKVLAHWPLAHCEKPSGLAMDAKTDRLFAVCANKQMVVVDAQSGRLVAELPIGGSSGCHCLRSGPEDRLRFERCGWHADRGA